MKIKTSKTKIIEEEEADGELEIDVGTTNPAELFQMAMEERADNRQVATKLFEMASAAFVTSSFDKAICLKHLGHYTGYTAYLDEAILILNDLATPQAQLQIAHIQFMQASLAITKETTDFEHYHQTLSAVIAVSL